MQETGGGPREGPPEGRFRLAAAELAPGPGSRMRVRVELARGEERRVAERDGVGTETLQLRLAAEAVLEALQGKGPPLPFQLIGVKRIHAFDADVVMASVGDLRRSGFRYLGAVPVRRTLVHAAAAAVLDALNRVLPGTGGAEPTADRSPEVPDGEEPGRESG